MNDCANKKEHAELILAYKIYLLKINLFFQRKNIEEIVKTRHIMYFYIFTAF